MNFTDIYNEIRDSFSVGNLFWGVVGSIIAYIIIEVFIFIFKKRYEVKKSKNSINLQSKIQLGGCMLIITSLLIFLLIQVLGIELFSKNFFLKKYTSIYWLINFFVLGYSLFTVTYILTELRKIIIGESSVIKLVENLSRFGLVLTVIVFSFLSSKIGFEAYRGYSLEEIEQSNLALRPILKFLLDAIFIFGSSLICITLFKFLIALFRPQNRT